MFKQFFIPLYNAINEQKQQFFDTKDRISLIKEQGKPHSVLHFRGPLLTYKEVTSRKPLRPHHVG